MVVSIERVCLLPAGTASARALRRTRGRRASPRSSASAGLHRRQKREVLEIASSSNHTQESESELQETDRWRSPSAAARARPDFLSVCWLARQEAEHCFLPSGRTRQCTARPQASICLISYNGAVEKKKSNFFFFKAEVPHGPSASDVCWPAAAKGLREASTVNMTVCRRHSDAEHFSLLTSKGSAFSSHPVRYKQSCF